MASFFTYIKSKIAPKCDGAAQYISAFFDRAIKRGIILIWFTYVVLHVYKSNIYEGGSPIWCWKSMLLEEFILDVLGDSLGNYISYLLLIILV